MKTVLTQQQKQPPQEQRPDDAQTSSAESREKTSFNVSVGERYASVLSVSVERVDLTGTVTRQGGEQHIDISEDVTEWTVDLPPLSWLYRDILRQDVESTIQQAARIEQDAKQVETRQHSDLDAYPAFPDLFPDEPVELSLPDTLPMADAVQTISGVQAAESVHIPDLLSVDDVTLTTLTLEHVAGTPMLTAAQRVPDTPQQSQDTARPTVTATSSDVATLQREQEQFFAVPALTAPSLDTPDQYMDAETMAVPETDTILYTETERATLYDTDTTARIESVLPVTARTVARYLPAERAVFDAAGETYSQDTAPSAVVEELLPEDARRTQPLQPQTLEPAYIQETEQEAEMELVDQELYELALEDGLLDVDVRSQNVAVATYDAEENDGTSKRVLLRTPDTVMDEDTTLQDVVTYLTDTGQLDAQIVRSPFYSHDDGDYHEEGWNHHAMLWGVEGMDAGILEYYLGDGAGEMEIGSDRINRTWMQEEGSYIDIREAEFHGHSPVQNQEAEDAWESRYGIDPNAFTWNERSLLGAMLEETLYGRDMLSGSTYDLEDQETIRDAYMNVVGTAPEAVLDTITYGASDTDPQPAFPSTELSVARTPV